MGHTPTPMPHTWLRIMEGEGRTSTRPVSLTRRAMKVRSTAGSSRREGATTGWKATSMARSTSSKSLWTIHPTVPSVDSVCSTHQAPMMNRPPELGDLPMRWTPCAGGSTPSAPTQAYLAIHLYPVNTPSFAFCSTNSVSASQPQPPPPSRSAQPSAVCKQYGSVALYLYLSALSAGVFERHPHTRCWARLGAHTPGPF